MTSAAAAPPLQETWRQYQVDHPHVHIRDAAALGVSEAELLATGVGDTVTQLAAPTEKPGWGKVIERLPALGRVMALTRNEHCVHERKGLYREIGFFGFMGNVVGPDIDLRFFSTTGTSALRCANRRRTAAPSAASSSSTATARRCTRCTSNPRATWRPSTPLRRSSARRSRMHR